MTDRLTNFAKALRKNETEAEKLLWRHLRAGRLNGLKFRRQQPVGQYIADFICLEKKLVIELDGGQHSEPSVSEYDKDRNAWFEKEGYMVMRFWNNEVLAQTQAILEMIYRHAQGGSKEEKE